MSFLRFIPTYVGHTMTDTVQVQVAAGSSPHTWGILMEAYEEYHAARFIPTYVGHTLDLRKKNGWFQPLLL